MAERGSQRWIVPVLAFAFGAGLVSAPGSARASDGAAEATDAKVKVCFSNASADAGLAVISNHLDERLADYDTELADDLRVGKRPCRVREIAVVGRFWGGIGPADSVTVTFFEDDGGRPGTVVSTQTVDPGNAAPGNFELRLSRVDLRSRTTYWMSTVANVDFAVGGQWGWELTSHQVGSGPVWRNPADGLGSGCTDWTPLEDCFGSEYAGLDAMFEVRGKRRG